MASATGTLTRNVARHAHAPTSTPPKGSPRAAVAAPAICSPPSTPPGGLSSPACSARRRISSIADGYPAEVPTPIRTRAAISVVRFWPTPPTTPPASTSPIPARNTRRGPNSSDSFPAVGWAIELARYNAETSTAIRPTDTCIAAAIGTSAVAISELLTGLSADPMNSGVVNRHEKAFRPPGGTPGDAVPGGAAADVTGRPEGQPGRAAPAA